MKIMLANFTKMVDDSGGMAKVTCSFANEMLKRGHEVTLVFSDEKDGKFFYPIEDKVICYDLRKQNGQRVKFPLWLKAKRELLRAFSTISARTINNDFAELYLAKELKKLLEKIKPDTIVSFQPAASKLLLCDLEIDIPVITMSHGDPEDYFKFYPQKEIPALVKSVSCQVLLPSFEKHIKNHLPKAKTITIGNAIPQFENIANLLEDKKTYKILFAARLAKGHKRPHLLIEAFSKLAKEFPNWQVELWGAKDGELYYKELVELIKKRNLEKQVFLMGATNDVPSILRQGDIFAFPSAFEGFGLSLAEAMSMGLPAVGYKNCTAVNEIIIDGETGYLCEEGIDDFANKLALLMKDKQKRVVMGQAGHERMKQYAPTVIWDKWEKLLMESVCK